MGKGWHRVGSCDTQDGSGSCWILQTRQAGTKLRTMLIDTNLRDTDLGLFPHRWKDHTKETWPKVGSLYFTVCFPLCGSKSQSLKPFLSLKEPGFLCAA